MSSRVARETLQGHVKYPEELPQSRGNNTTICSLIVMAMVLAFCLAGQNDQFVSFGIILMCYLFLLFVAELLTRVTYYAEEIKHLKSRYKGSHWDLLKKLMDFTVYSWIYFVISGICTAAALLMYDIDHIKEHWENISIGQMCGILGIGDLLRRIVHLNKNPISNSLFLETLQRLDYGSGIAQSFFYGYLRLCLPNTGDQEKGIQEKIDDYIARERLSEDNFPVKKLFVLIPASTYVPNDLKDCSFGWMESAGSLEELHRDRAGVKLRKYKNSVYRIKNPDDSSDKGTYVVAEGATPCKTLYEVIQHSGSRKEFYKEHQKEIIFNFYDTLRETLREDRDCRDLCEFIYYVDTDEYGGYNVNVAKLILQRIEEIREKEEHLREVRDRNI